MVTRPLAPGHPGYHTTLQVRWLGTTCYLIQLGDVAILTDPFLSYHPAMKVALSTIESDPLIVRREIGRLPVADAVFVGHSHYDHLLDVDEVLRQPRWGDVPVVGSETTRNILCGYDEGWVDNWRPALTDGRWHTITWGLEYQVIRAEHAPNLKCGPISYTAYPGSAEECLKRPPRRAADFPMGETYAFVFRLSNRYAGEAVRPAEFTVYFAGSAANAPRGFPDESVQGVDLAILCVPGWTNTTGYPEAFIERLRPRSLLLAHYDNFLQRRRADSTVVPTAHLGRFLNVAEEAADHAEFEQILVPDVGAVMHFRKP